MKWAHSESVVYHRGQAKVFCKCGAQSGNIDRGQVEVWITNHRFRVGIRTERRPDATTGSDTEDA